MSSRESHEAEPILDPVAARSVPLVWLDTQVAHLGVVFHCCPPGDHRLSGRDRCFRPAPKHMVSPLGWQNFFGFVCTPRHRTYQNIRREGAFTVTFPRPSQVVLTSLSAAPRDDDDVKPALSDFCQRGRRLQLTAFSSRTVICSWMQAGPDCRRLRREQPDRRPGRGGPGGRRCNAAFRWRGRRGDPGRPAPGLPRPGSLRRDSSGPCLPLPRRLRAMNRGMRARKKRRGLLEVRHE